MSQKANCLKSYCYSNCIQAPHIGSGNVKLKEGRMMKELETLFHPNRYANIEADGRIIGGLAEVHPRFVNNFGVDKRVAILEIAIEPFI